MNDESIKDALTALCVNQVDSKTFEPIIGLGPDTFAFFKRVYGDVKIFANEEDITSLRVCFISPDGYEFCHVDGDGNVMIDGDEFKTEFVQAKMTLRLT